jgi:hypothetical protein
MDRVYDINAVKEESGNKTTFSNHRRDFVRNVVNIGLICLR